MKNKQLKFYKLKVLFPVLFMLFFKIATADNRPPLDIVFCLDLSGSTNGLINDLRDNLWTIVNHVQMLEPESEVRMGVIGFARPSFGKENAYVKVLVPLTANYDQLNQELYRLKPGIEKGDQYVAYALRACVMDMQWTKRKDARKMVFLVGNGMVADGQMEYLRYCDEARSRSIQVHTIYVMNSSNLSKELPGWRRIATITGGFQTEMIVNTPEEITTFTADWHKVEKLNKKLNVSLHWVGTDSSDCRRALSACDSGAYYAGTEAYLQRMYYKLSANFHRSLRSCELISRIDPNANSADAEISSSYYERLVEQARLRMKILDELRSQFEADELKQIQDKYMNLEIRDESVFMRCVLNIIYKAWY